MPASCHQLLERPLEKIEIVMLDTQLPVWLKRFMIAPEECWMRQATTRASAARKRIGKCHPHRRDRLVRHHLIELVGTGPDKKYITQPASHRLVGAFLQTIGFDIERNIGELGMTHGQLYAKQSGTGANLDTIDGAWLPLLEFEAVVSVGKFGKLVLFALSRNDEIVGVQSLGHYSIVQYY